MAENFMEENSSWVIDGNYGKLFYWERMEQADKIIMMRFNRFDALCRVVRRYWANRATWHKAATKNWISNSSSEY